MTQEMATTLSRRGWLSRLLMAAAVAPVLGATLTERVHADKKDTKKQKREKRIRKRAQAEADACNQVPGQWGTINKRPGGTTVTCSDGQGPVYTCTYNSKGSRCRSHVISGPNSADGSTPPPPPPPCSLQPLGASCSGNAECCSGGCNGQCCLPDGAACASPGDCCGGICSGGFCSSLV